MTEPSEREMQVVKLVASGLSQKETAAKLGLDKNTVQHHWASGSRKLGLKSPWEAAMYFLAKGLIKNPFLMGLLCLCLGAASQPPMPPIGVISSNGKALKIIRQKLSKTPRQTGNRNAPMAKSSSINSKSIGINLIVAPPRPFLAASWNPSAGADGYTLTAWFSNQVVGSWLTTSTNISVYPPAGFPYLWAVESWVWASRTGTTNLFPLSQNGYGPQVPASPILPTNVVSILQWSNQVAVAGLLTNAGRFQSTISLPSTNWSTVGTIPANTVTVLSQPLAQRQYFRLASP